MMIMKGSDKMYRGRDLMIELLYRQLGVLNIIIEQSIQKEYIGKIEVKLRIKQV